jgi:hypothetical protein
MGRAIAIFAVSAATVFPRPFGRMSPGLSAFWRELTWHLFDGYRPERQYMRGPGPMSRAKNGK